jgi:hypothetical protein
VHARSTPSASVLYWAWGVLAGTSRELYHRLHHCPELLVWRQVLMSVRVSALLKSRGLQLSVPKLPSAQRVPSVLCWQQPNRLKLRTLHVTQPGLSSGRSDLLWYATAAEARFALGGQFG